MSSINSFADSLFRFLFGWARSLLQRIWNAAFSGGLNGFFTWLGDHWLIVALLLCLAGTAVDFIVWMIRWRPYLVWRTKLRRFLRFLRGGREESTDPKQFARGYRSAVALELPVTAGQAPPVEEHWTEAEWTPAAVWQPIPEQPAPAAPVVQPDSRAAFIENPQQTRTNPPIHVNPTPAQPAIYGAPAAPGYSAPQPAPAAYEAPAQEAAALRARRFAPAADYELPPIEPSGRAHSAYPTDLPAARRKRRSQKYDRKRSGIRQFLVNATEEEEGMLDGLPPVVDRQQAFHEPVYPQQPQEPYPAWQNNPTNGNQSL